MPTQAPQGDQSARSSTSRVSTISEDLTITGNVSSNGEVRLDGQVQGDINCRSLILGERSRLNGNAEAEEVVVQGSLIGSIRAERVTLQSKSHVEGDIIHQNLAIEAGAYFDGVSHHPEGKLSVREAVPAERSAKPPATNGSGHQENSLSL